MSSKAYRIPSATDRLRKQQIQIKNLQAMNRLRNTPRPVAATATAGVSAAGDVGGTGNFLRTQGDTMIGPLALAPPVDFQIQIDSDGAINIGESSSNSQYTSNIQLDDIQPNTFVLDTIDGAAFDGQIIVIRTFAPSTPFTIAQATLANGGNIQTLTDADFTLGDLQLRSFIFDESLVVFSNTGGTWREWTGAGGGGGGLTEPVILTVNEITPETLPTTSVVDWSKNPNHITLDRDVEFSFANLPASGSYEGVLVIIDVDATGGFAAPVWPASLTNPPTVSTTALTRTSVMLYTIDGGTIVTHATSVGSSTGGGALLSNVVIDVNKNWLNFSISNLGGLTMTGDIDVATFDVLNIDRATFADDGSSITANNIAQMVLNSSGSFQTNVDTGDDFVWTILNDTILTAAEDVSNNSVLTLQSRDDTGGAVMEVFRNDIDGLIPTALVIGSYGFQTGTDTASLVGEYASIQGVEEDPTTGAIEGSMDLLAADGSGGQSTFISINDGANNLVDIFKETDMNTHKIVNVVDPTAAQDAATKQYVDDNTGVQSSIVDGNTTATVLDSAPSFSVVLNGVQKFSIANTRVDYEELGLFGVTEINMNDSGATLISSLQASSAGLNLNIISTSDVYNLQFNSVDAFNVDNTKTLITSTTPNTTASLLQLFRDDASPALNDVTGEIEFRGRDSVAANIVYGKIGVEIEVTTAASSEGSFQWTLRNNGVNQDMMSLLDGVLGVSRHLPTAAASGAALVLERIDSGAAIGDEAGEISFNINDGTPRVIGVIQTTWDDTQVGDNSSRMDFQLETDDVLRNILTIRGSPITDNKTSIEISGETLLFAKTGVLGYFVTSDPTISSSIGDNGTIQIPQFSQGSASLAQLNAAFGAFDGAIGQDISDGRLYVRKSSTVWSFYSESGTVV